MPSPSPPREDRSRSKSPQREDSSRRLRSPGRAPRTKNFSGLKWKDNSRRGDDRDDRDNRRDQRGGFRDRDDDRRRDDRYGRGNDSRRDDDRFGRGQDSRRRDFDGPNRGQGRLRDRDDGDERKDRRREQFREARDKVREEKSKESKDKPPAAPPAAPGQQMIIVTVNDRLGTKAQIPCLPSDPVKVFKAMVAARIGRPVHEIMLKRQGERPFKDQLTLEDYGVSNGVQIDLELDTGD
ncbi:ubiquitin-like protein [Aaosphaeria arxii CBS 175.79]|uniref:Ubiquitin-like modifier HUB1 n=1 Tax=Aaosphaeria arxii CBS 175.79 TaxID=1450172 RepID=A0A6A5Y6S9_9PLEO|nr:ubiquitin-like protein [Aaosphaeria arxii CBS 175.79]KAF2020264.1 ubiquitin-like protein [Aaosphaeria arxii CBS 175.79]